MTEENKLEEGGLSVEQIKHWVELIATVIMSIATVATAWSGYQSARWGGEQAVNFTQAGANRTESVRASIQGGQRAIFDAVVFNEWLKAKNLGDETLADFYYQRMGDLQPAVDAWIALDPLNDPQAPGSPFATDAYSLAAFDEAQQLEARASELFDKGLEANQIGDDYVFNAVLLASVLFFAGVSGRIRSKNSQIFMIVIASLLLLYGLYNVATYPIF